MNNLARFTALMVMLLLSQAAFSNDGLSGDSREDYFGKWLSMEYGGGSSHIPSFIITADDYTMQIGSQYKISQLAWTTVINQNDETRDDYPSGYKITGIIADRGRWILHEEDEDTWGQNRAFYLHRENNNKILTQSDDFTWHREYYRAGTAFGESFEDNDIKAKLLLDFRSMWWGMWHPHDNYALKFIHDNELPQVQHELPEALIGQFVLVTPYDSFTMFIFPDNKYVLFIDIHRYDRKLSFGYIVKKDNSDSFCFAVESREDTFGLNEIHFNGAGFFIDTKNHEVIRAIRKEDISAPEHSARNKPLRKAKREYFSFDNAENDTIAFRDKSLHEIKDFYDSAHTYHYLQIGSDVAEIHCVFSSGELGVTFAGFMHITEETADSQKGIIQFTNGPPFYYVEDGTADIEIKNDGSITITMLYKPNPDWLKEKSLLDKFQWPAKLTLEF